VLRVALVVAALPAQPHCHHHRPPPSSSLSPVTTLSAGQNFTTLATYAFQSRDYQILPTQPWAYALVVPDLAHPASAFNFTRVGPPPTKPYDSTAPPVMLTAQARLLSGWVEADNAAAAPPPSPVNCSGPAGPCGAVVSVTLVPFGSTHLRMAEVPYVTA